MPVSKRVTPRRSHASYMVAGYKGFGDRYVYIPPCLRKDMSRQSPTTPAHMTQVEIEVKARSLCGRLSVADVISVEASEIISDILDLQDAFDFWCKTATPQSRTELLMWEMNDMLETAMAMIEDASKAE